MVHPDEQPGPSELHLGAGAAAGGAGIQHGHPDELYAVSAQGDGGSREGAGNFRILWSILLPVLLPSLATVGLFAFVYHWNDWFSGALFINNPSKYPLQTYLQTLLTNMRDMMRQSGSNYYELLQRMNEQTGRASQLFLGLVPILVVYPFVQKYFTTGLVMGSVKG